MGGAEGMIDAISRRKLAHIEFTEQRGSGTSESRDYGRIVRGNEISQQARAPSGAKAFGPELVFDRKGNTVQWSSPVAAHDRLLCLAGGLQGFIAADGDIAMQFAVHGSDTVEVRGHRFNGGNLLLVDQLAQRCGREKRDLSVIHVGSFHGEG